MRLKIGDREYALCDRVREDETARRGFLNLANRVFGLDFMPWLAGGWWGGDYIPHALMDRSRVAANVSVNVIRSNWKGEEKRFVQLGTVMTDPEYRGRGLARRLMEEVLARCENTCDGVYLYANDSVLDFYPKFGFAPVEEYQYRLPVRKSGVPARRLNMAEPACRKKLADQYLLRGNPYSALPVMGNAGLLMFHCAQYLQEHIFEIPEYDAMAVARQDGETMLCYDVFGGGAPLREILNALAREETKTAALGFTPADFSGFDISLRREEDSTMFVQGELKGLFSGNRLMFPLLSHA